MTQGTLVAGKPVPASLPRLTFLCPITTVPKRRSRGAPRDRTEATSGEAGAEVPVPCRGTCNWAAAPKTHKMLPGRGEKLPWPTRPSESQPRAQGARSTGRSGRHWLGLPARAGEKMGGK